METIKSDKVETVGIELREIDGLRALFTTDGKLIAGQITKAGHPWHLRDPYTGEKADTWRATIKIDDDACRNATGRPLYGK